MKCLIIDHMHPAVVELLKAENIEVDYHPDISWDDVKNIIHDYEGLVVRSKLKVDQPIIDSGTKLKFVARAGAGTDNIDTQLLEEKDIKIINAPEGNRNALAEHTMGMLLSLLHNITKSNEEIKKGAWHREANRGTELAGKTVGLLGYGFMGQAFAKKLKAFDCRVIAYDKYKNGFSDEYCKEVSMQTIFDESDIFSIHVPLTEETKNLVNFDFIKSFNKKIYLLNTSRGDVLSMKTCRQVLEHDIVFGIGLDVLENENLNKLSDEQRDLFDYLRDSDRVVITPHVAGWSTESYEQISRVLANKIIDFLASN
ncbi:MAG: NAD(P)-dependent oxidoreductase [Fulvivirga sp.]|nr:NAD(P)-dependent oxidoreductase [Fulvivirga sp.]